MKEQMNGRLAQDTHRFYAQLHEKQGPLHVSLREREEKECVRERLQEPDSTSSLQPGTFPKEGRIVFWMVKVNRIGKAAPPPSVGSTDGGLALSPGYSISPKKR